MSGARGPSSPLCVRFYPVSVPLILVNRISCVFAGAHLLLTILLRRYLSFNYRRVTCELLNFNYAKTAPDFSPCLLMVGANGQLRRLWADVRRRNALIEFH